MATQKDIRDIGARLTDLMMAEVEKDDQPNVKLLVGGLGSVLTQAFLDLNRIADALEQIALNTQPR